MTNEEYSHVPFSKEDMARWGAELKEQCQLADVGELAGQVTHKFNNFLNSLLLKIALLEAELPEPLAAKFLDIKLQAKSMADVIKQVHQFQRRQTLIQVMDLNPLIREVADAMGREAAGVSIQLDLSSQPARVSGSPVDLRRLIFFILRSRLAVPGPEQRVLLLHTKVADAVHLVLEDSVSNLPASLVANLFDGDAKSLEGAHRLELGACKAIVRRNQGRIRAQATEDGGLLIDAAFPLAQDGVPN